MDDFVAEALLAASVAIATESDALGISRSFIYVFETPSRRRALSPVSLLLRPLSLSPLRPNCLVRSPTVLLWCSFAPSVSLTS